MPFSKRLGELVSNWIGHPLEAIVLAMILAIISGVLVGFTLPVASLVPCLTVAIAVFMVLIVPYWLLRRHGLLEPDVPFTFGYDGRPARLVAYRLFTVYIAGRLATGQKRFTLLELNAVVYKIITAVCADGERAFALYGGSDRPMTDVEETQVLSVMRAFVADGQMYEESGFYIVTVKGELIFRSSAKAAYETDETTVTMVCEELGLDAEALARHTSKS